MNADVIRVLEFSAVREILAGFTSTKAGRELALALEPMDDPEQVQDALARATEMFEALQERLRTTVGGVEDVREHVRRSKAGGAPLECRALWDIAALCETAQGVGAALDRLGESYPLLSEMGRKLPRLPQLVKRIKQAVDPAGKLKDEATPRLAQLRLRLRYLRRRIEEILTALIRSSAVGPHLQYPNPSIHHDRYVLPVNANHKHDVPGVVHGSSDSGATLYIEPTQTVDMGNELSASVDAEQDEVADILRDITRHVAHESGPLLAAQRTLAELDLLVAKARMARRYRMSRPAITEGKVLELIGARHPILLRLTEKPKSEDLPPREPDFDGVVPLDVHVGDDFRVLVITGPNTGGKTVTLKTVGILCLMARAGLYVPAERAVVPLCDDVYADIGDEQSLQQSLSTFSSHMSRIIRVLNAATERSLVLLDELGSGTDPLEGAALGQAVLNELVRRGCAAIVTTHLGQLKTFAATCSQAENACMEFDTVTLRPTFRLTIGAAGHSNALEIADRLGMPAVLLEDARKMLNEASQGEYDRTVAQVRQATLDAEERRRRAKYLESEAEKIKQEYERILARIRDEEDRTGAGIGLKMKDDLQQLVTVASQVYDEVRFSHKAVARKVREVRDGLRAALERTEELVAGRQPKRPIQRGDEVYVTKVHKWGQVTEVDGVRKRATVQVADMLLDVPLEELVPWGSDAGKRKG